jgi:hypothetical protein
MSLKIPIEFNDAASLMTILNFVPLSLDHRKGDEDIGYGRKFQIVAFQEGNVVYFFISEARLHFGEGH